MQPPDLLLALAVFAVVTSATPGPNNLMVMASGVNFGVVRTLPHVLGISCGFPLMLVLVGLGFERLFAAWPLLYGVLKVGGVLYMLVLAWKLAGSHAIGDSAGAARPMRFLQAAAFQWVNPKAWAIAVSAAGAYTMPQDFALSVLVVALVFAAVSVPSLAVWVLFGVGVKRLLSDPRVIRRFNLVMAFLLVASLWPVVADALSL